MKFFLRILLIAGLAFVAGLFLPGPVYSLAIIAFGVGLIFGKKPRRRRVYGKQKPHRPFSFWSGFLGGIIAWGGYAYWLDSGNDSLLSSRVFGLFPLDTIPENLGPLFLLLLTSLIAGLIAGFASMSGQFLGEIVK
jgi:hypothetical protein